MNQPLLSLLRCLYEAQDPYLCQSVVDQLEALDISTTSLNPMDLLSIGYLISISSTKEVKNVDLKFCHIGDSDVTKLMKYIACGNGGGMWKFSLYGNDIHEEGAASIAEVLQSSIVINSIDLMGNSIGAGGLQSIAEALITNTSLVELNLYQCSLKITEENGPIITDMLLRNKTLRKLQLMANPDISDTGVFFIAEGLGRNRALKWLEMNRIDAKGGKSLASAITVNTSLVELELRGLEITDDSGPTFVGTFQQNKSLETVRLTVSEIGIPFIARGLQ